MFSLTIDRIVNTLTALHLFHNRRFILTDWEERKAKGSAVDMDTGQQ